MQRNKSRGDARERGSKRVLPGVICFILFIHSIAPQNVRILSPVFDFEYLEDSLCERSYIKVTPSNIIPPVALQCPVLMLALLRPEHCGGHGAPQLRYARMGPF